MYLFDGNSKPIIIDNIFGPIVSEYMWILDLELKDFKLTQITVLEEIICPSFELQILGTRIILPATWYVLVYDPETSQLDVVQIADTAGREFTAFVYGPTLTHPLAGRITVTDYFIEHKNVGPLLNKGQMLCHPIGPNEWINVSPSDSYNKYLKDNIVGDLLGY